MDALDVLEYVKNNSSHDVYTTLELANCAIAVSIRKPVTAEGVESFVPEFSWLVVETFSEQWGTGMFTPKFHQKDHTVENKKRSGRLKLLSNNLLPVAN